MADTTTTQTPAKLASDEYINKMYDANLASQKETLTQGYNQNLANLDREQQQTQKQTDANLNRTHVEAQQQARNYGEVQNAYGLSSGAMAQAKLAQSNQLRNDLTDLRGVQAEADAEIERERSLLAKQYASEIAKAQADNDRARVEALYKDAADKEARMLEYQKQIASVFAQHGDYSYFQKLYGLTDAEIAKLYPQPVVSYGGGYAGSSGGSSSGAENTGKKPAGDTKDQQKDIQSIYNQALRENGGNVAAGTYINKNHGLTM